MSRESKTYPLRLPRSLKEALVRIAKEEGTSINQFVATAVAEKISALNTEAFFAERRARADDKAFDRILDREGGEPPREGDEFQFPFGDRAAIENLAKMYWGRDMITPEERESETNRIPEILKRARQRGYLLEEEFITLASWKARKRNQRHFEKNSTQQIKSVTRKALAARTRREALEQLDALQGVALPTASAILHWFRDDTPIIDRRVIEALGYNNVPESKKYNYDFYAEVADQVIREAERVGVSLREMDRALWAWQKAYARPRTATAHACA